MARPIYLILVFAWIWRVALATVLIGRLMRLGLAVVPTHADRAGGLTFMERLPTAFVPVVFAISSVLAARWAHEVVQHGAHVQAYLPMLATFVALALGLFTAPLLVLGVPLHRIRRTALLQYGALTTRQVDDPILAAPELGPLADVATAYTAVVQMRPVPIGMTALGPLAIAAGLPMLAFYSLQVPVADILKKLLAALL